MGDFSKKLLGIFLGISLSLGVGVSLSNSVHREAVGVRAADEVVYTLTPSSLDNKNPYNNYTDAKDITINNITWSATGNVSLTPWRFGGKNLSSTNRLVYCKTAIQEKISKVVLTVQKPSKNAVTVNSLTFSVHSSADNSAKGVTDVSSISKIEKSSPTIDTSETTFTFSNTDNADWTNKFYSFNFSVNNSNNSNYYVFLLKRNSIRNPIQMLML